MSMQTKKNISIALLAAAMLLWILRKMNVLYIPGLSMFLLAVSMLIVGFTTSSIPTNAAITVTQSSLPATSFNTKNEQIIAKNGDSLLSMEASDIEI